MSQCLCLYIATYPVSIIHRLVLSDVEEPIGSQRSRAVVGARAKTIRRSPLSQRHTALSMSSGNSVTGASLPVSFSISDSGEIQQIFRCNDFGRGAELWPPLVCMISIRSVANPLYLHPLNGKILSNTAWWRVFRRVI